MIRKDGLDGWAAQADGGYLLRTNLEGKSAEELWRTDIGLTQIEDSFRIAQHDLGLRPIFHHKEQRTQAHILVCFLSRVLWRTLPQWMAASGLGSAPRKLLEELAQVCSLDVVLPTAAGPELRLRTVSRPEPHLAILLQHTGGNQSEAARISGLERSHLNRMLTKLGLVDGMGRPDASRRSTRPPRESE